MVFISIGAYAQPFAKVQPSIENGDYVSIDNMDYCNVIYGKDIYTPQGKVTKQNIQGFIECANLPACLMALNVDEKHIISDTLTQPQANQYAKENEYKTFIWNNTIYITN